MPATPSGTGQANSGPAPISHPSTQDTPTAPRATPGARRRRCQATSVRLCPLHTPHRFNDVLTAVLDSVVTTYTRTGDRVLLATRRSLRSDSSDSSDRSDRLAEAIRRLGREPAIARRRPSGCGPGAGLSGPVQPNGPGGLDRSGESGTGPGPRPETATAGLDQTGADRDQNGPVPPADRSGPPPDRVRLIITAQGFDTDRMSDWARMLTPDGTLVVLTHSDYSGDVPITGTRDLIVAARLAGLTLTDRLIFLHGTPSTRPPASDHQRRRITLGAHHRIHTDAYILTPPASEASRA